MTDCSGKEEGEKRKEKTEREREKRPSCTWVSKMVIVLHWPSQHRAFMKRMGIHSIDLLLIPGMSIFPED